MSNEGTLKSYAFGCNFPTTRVHNTMAGHVQQPIVVQELALRILDLMPWVVHSPYALQLPFLTK